MKIEFRWEAIDAQTLRAKVAGGWLVRFHSQTGAVAMTMVADPKHQWVVKVPKESIAEARERLEKMESNLKDPYIEDAIKAEMKEEIDHLRRFVDSNS